MIVWNNKTVVPPIGSIIVVKKNDAIGYGLYDIKNTTIQQQIITDPSITQWAEAASFIGISGAAGKVLSGIKEGIDNDWAPASNGYVQEERDIYMLRQQINARIQTLPNEVDGFDGIDYINVIFGKTSVEQKAVALVDVIRNIPAVKDVTFINASWVDKVAGTFQFLFNIQSIFGDLQFSMGIDTQNRTVFNTENA